MIFGYVLEKQTSPAMQIKLKEHAIGNTDNKIVI